MIISVVGNANSIFNKNNGKLIDEADMIIRFNHGNIRDPEQQGIRTDVFVYSRYHKIVDENAEIWHTLQPEYDDIKKHLTKALNAKPSNGIIILEKLRRENAEDTIRIFGFDWKATKTWYKKAERVLPPDPHPHAQHDFAKEREYCLKLIKEMGWELY